MSIYSFIRGGANCVTFDELQTCSSYLQPGAIDIIDNDYYDGSVMSQPYDCTYIETVTKIFVTGFTKLAFADSIPRAGQILKFILILCSRIIDVVTCDLRISNKYGRVTN
jgi:hypothetical protein